MTGSRESRPPIPADVQREVRQRCGFGCVICGMPLYEYDHVLGWAITKTHQASDLALLCDQHHREKTNGLLTAEQIKAANGNPFNKQSGISAPYDLHFGSDRSRIVVGNNCFECVPGQGFIAVAVDGIPLIEFRERDGHLLLNVIAFDRFNNVVLQIVDNELVYSTSPWDITLIGRQLTIREASSRFLIDIVFEPPSRIVVKRGRLLCNGVEVAVTAKYLAVLNDTRFIRNCFARAPIGLAVGRAAPVPTGIAWPDVPRYDIDRVQAARALRRAIREQEQLLQSLRNVASA